MSITPREFLGRCPDGDDYLDLLDFALSCGVVIAYAPQLGSAFPGRLADADSTGDDVPPIIRWGLGTNQGELPAVDAMCILFHELGHSRQPALARDEPAAKLGTKESYQREVEAWDIGWSIIHNSGRNIPAGMEEGFTRRRTRDLKTHEEEMKRRLMFESKV